MPDLADSIKALKENQMDQSTHGIHRAFKISFRLSPLLLLIFVNACAEVQLNTIPTPSPTSKVRVFLHAFTGHAVQVRWADSDEKWARIQVQSVERFLKETAIYELPTEEEVAQVSRHKTFSIRDWSKKDWSLVRKMGQALHTDYAMVMERSAAGGFKYFDTLLINVETGKRFRISSRVKLAPANKEALFQMQMVAYNELFRDAKNDLLATAIRKGRLASPKSFPEQTSMPERGSVPIVVPPKTTETTSGSLGPRKSPGSWITTNCLWG